VIASVPPSSSDKVYIENLCRNELHLIIEVVKCRPLGQPRPDRYQPILATLRSSGEVEAVVRDDIKLYLEIESNSDHTEL